MRRAAPPAENDLVADAAEHRDLGLLTELVATQHAVVASDRDLDAAMAEIAQQAHRLTRADAAVVELLEGDELVYRAVTGVAERFEGLRMKVDLSLSGRTVRSGEILWCQDAASDPRVDVGAAREAGARSMVMVPLAHRRKPVGVLKVWSARPFAFGERELRVTQMLAGTLGVAIARGELLQRLAAA